MANFKFDMPDDFINQLKKCADIEKIAPKMINAALPIVLNAFKSTLAEHKRTGELIQSLEILPAKEFKNGAWGGTVTATGTATGKYYLRNGRLGERQREAFRNHQKLLALEYGTSKQRPSPVINKTVNKVKDKVIDTMQAVFEKEVKGD